MADARSKLDILYQDVLGEIHEVINRVDALKADIPSAADQAAQKLELQTGTMLAAADKLRGVLGEMAKQVDNYADTATKKAVEAGKLDVQKAAVTAASESVRVAVGEEVRAVVAEVTQAAQQLAAEAERTRGSISAASRQVAWGWGKGLSAMFGASVAGALVMFLTLQLTGLVNVKPAELSDADRQALQNGRTLNKVWNNLTQKERDHINELARSAQ